MSLKEVEWAQKFDTVKTFFDRLAVKRGKSEGTIRIYSAGSYAWTEFSKLTPDETVAKWKTEAKRTASLLQISVSLRT